jgi:hypothetical protein
MSSRSASLHVQLEILVLVRASVTEVLGRCMSGRCRGIWLSSCDKYWMSRGRNRVSGQVCIMIADVEAVPDDRGDDDDGDCDDMNRSMG